MLRAGLAIRQGVRDATSLEEASDLIVRYLYENCVDLSTGERACALVRFYKTHQFGHLEPDLQRFAEHRMESRPVADSLRCLTLLGTAGDAPAWNSRHDSRGHRAIPLPSADSVRAAPMIMRLVEDMGVDIERILAGTEPATRSPDARTYDVFHVEDALGSPYIPAQSDFVVPYRIASVVGFGGLLRTGELFALILFSRGRIPARSAARFRAIALDVRSALFRFEDSNTWKA